MRQQEVVQKKKKNCSYSKESVELGCDLILDLLYQRFKVERMKSVNHWHFAWFKNTPKQKCKLFSFLQSFNSLTFSRVPSKIMGILKKSKESAKAQKT